MCHDVQPVGDLFADIDSDVAHLAVLLEILSAFVNEELGVLEQVLMVGNHPIGSGAIRLLIAHREKNHVAIERHRFALQCDHHHQLSDAFVLHVLGAAAINGAVEHLAAKRRHSPVRSIAGDDVHVVQKHNRTF